MVFSILEFNWSCNDIGLLVLECFVTNSFSFGFFRILVLEQTRFSVVFLMVMVLMAIWLQRE